MDRQELVKQFVAEANEHLARIERHLVALETAPDASAHIHAVFQAIHGIKGTSDYVSLTSISRLSHEMESLLNRLRRGSLRVDPEVVDVVLRGVDLLKDCIEHSSQPDHRAVDIAAYVEQLTRFKQAARPVVRPAPRRPGEALGGELLGVFRSAAVQHIEALHLALADIRAGERVESAHQVVKRRLRTFHSSASYIAAGEVVDRLAAIQATLPEPTAWSAEAAATLDEQLKALERAVATFQSEPEPAKVPPAEAGADAAELIASASDDTLRVSMSKLDDFMTLVSELVLVKNTVAHLAERARVERASGELTRQLQAASLQLGKTTTHLQDQLMLIRLVPIRHLFERFQRVVRDLARNHGKEIRLRTLGAETEVDKGVADLLHEPLVHLVRNAIAHGIESPDERTAAGKPASGTITLKATHESRAISVEIMDDGRGFDPDRISAAATRDGLLSSAEASALTETELVNLAFRPGISTADGATSLSGRGVGLAAVSSNLKRLGGNVQLDWERGEGTRFRLTIPLTLAMIETLIVEVADQRFALPTSAVTENLRIPNRRITKLNRVRVILHEDDALPVLPLRELLGLALPETEPETHTAVVVHQGGQRFGLLVDRIVIRQDSLIRPLDPELGKLSQFSGATVMSDGRLVLILNPAGLISRRAG